MKVPAWAVPVFAVAWLAIGLYAFWPSSSETPAEPTTVPTVPVVELPEGVRRFCDGPHMVYLWQVGGVGVSTDVVWNDPRCRR